MSTFGLDIAADDWHLGLFQPPSLGVSVCTLWLRSDSPDIVTVSDDVSPWPDQGDCGHDYQQTTAARRPDFISGQLPTVRFDHTNTEFLIGPAPNSVIGSGAHHVLAVSTSSAGGPGIYGTNAGVPPLYQLQRASATYNTTSLSYAGNDSLAVRHWYHDGTNFRYRENGTELDSAAVAPVVFPAAVTLVGRAGGTYMTGDYKELIVIRRALGAREIDVLESYAMARYL